MKKLLALFGIFALVGCGESGSSDVPGVGGIYEITEGTCHESVMGDEQVVDLTGKFVLLSQSGKVIMVFDCGSVLKPNEDGSHTAGVSSCTSYNLDPGAGPGFFFMSGSTVFYGKDKLGMTAQVVGDYPWIGFSFTLDYDFQAKLSAEYMSESCPSCNASLLGVPTDLFKKMDLIDPKLDSNKFLH